LSTDDDLKFTHMTQLDKRLTDPFYCLGFSLTIFFSTFGLAINPFGGELSSAYHALRLLRIVGQRNCFTISQYLNSIASGPDFDSVTVHDVQDQPEMPAEIARRARHLVRDRPRKCCVTLAPTFVSLIIDLPSIDVPFSGATASCVLRTTSFRAVLKS
jgi:hypothetical protein